ncbi:MAG: cytochrome c biogenesis protein CcsA [Planctomycetota bacterium]
MKPQTALAITAVALIAIVAAGSVVGAFLGLERAEAMFTSWVFAAVWLTSALAALAALVRVPALRRDPGRLALHAGLVLLVAGSMTGSMAGHRVATAMGMAGQPVQGRMRLVKDLPCNTVHVDRGAPGRSKDTHTLPFSLYLKELRIEHYPAETAVQAVPGRLAVRLNDLKSEDLDPSIGSRHTLAGGRLEVEILSVYGNFNVLPRESGSRHAPVFADAPGRPLNPAVHLRATLDGRVFEVVVFARFGAMYFPAGETPPPDDTADMAWSYTAPEAAPAGPVKDYLSTVEVREGDRVIGTHVIEVNRPLRMGGFHFLQYAVDDGESILLVVSDRGWYWGVLPGLILLAAGAGLFAIRRLAAVTRAKPAPSTAAACPVWAGRLMQALGAAAVIGLPMTMAALRLHPAGPRFVLTQYLLAAGLWLCAAALGLYGRGARHAARYTHAAAALIVTAAFIHRWLTTGQPPLQNMFEVMLALGAAYFPLMLLVERTLGVGLEWYDAFVNALILVPAAFVFDPVFRPLPPALQSGYFIPHVAVYLLAYVLMAKAAVLAARALMTRNDEAARMAREEEGFRAALLGFPLLTAGLILGALWARVAWGDWWSWDHKELWSLVSWLVYAAYLHVRVVRRQPGLLAGLLIAGLVAIVITLTWVNLARMFMGMHSYA